VHLVGFDYKNISRCTILRMSKLFLNLYIYIPYKIRADVLSLAWNFDKTEALISAQEYVYTVDTILNSGM
jgi:hypothetical protein